MQHKPSECDITVPDAIHEFWNVIQYILVHKNPFFEIIQHLQGRIIGIINYCRCTLCTASKNKKIVHVYVVMITKLTKQKHIKRKKEQLA